ncbi:hypothetical protein NIF40_08380, partial [[Clostridium] leptum]|nr:hypothetical protein [[Clostridium] leptum]
YMQLYLEILKNILESEETHIVFPNLKMDPKEIVEIESYRALQNIKKVLEDDNLGDEECFEKIEEIVCIFESIGSNAGNRHDFG